MIQKHGAYCGTIFEKGGVDMDLRFKQKNKTIIILISGEIDHHTSKELRRQTESVLA